MKFKIGDKVIVKKWSQMIQERGRSQVLQTKEECICFNNQGINFYEKMRATCGKEYIIENIISDPEYPYRPNIYILQGEKWRYVEEMLELVEEK